MKKTKNAVNNIIILQSLLLPDFSVYLDLCLFVPTNNMPTFESVSYLTMMHMFYFLLHKSYYNSSHFSCLNHLLSSSQVNS